MTIEEIKKEYEGNFIDWNSPNHFTEYYEGIKRVTPDAVFSFFAPHLQPTEAVKKIWKMSRALYNNSIADNDVAMSNHNALMRINKFCAEYLAERGKM